MNSTRTGAMPVPEARPWRRAIGWLAFLAPFFYLSYGASNALAALRRDVPSIVFGWEHHMPFLAWTIIPYWSIDAFYAASVFVCRNRAELDAHGRRLLTAQVVAVACFILFPLTFTFHQPATHGVAGVLFAALNSFDKPFNQAPSLHIALLLVLWQLYANRLPRVWQWPLHIWFALVGASVLTTYQHHFFDVPTGAVLGVFCLWLWPERERSPLATRELVTDRRRLVLAGRYAIAGGAIASLALWIGGTGWWLLWPAMSLVLVAINYAVLGPAGFQKDARGHMSVASRLLLAPYQASAFVNSRSWTRRAPQPVAIGDGVWLGRIPSAREAAAFGTVVDLCAELPGASTTRAWICIPMLDLVPPGPAQLLHAAVTIERARAAGTVLVCCALGRSRSAAAVATWLVTSHRAGNMSEALAIVHSARPRMVVDLPLRTAIATASRSAAPVLSGAWREVSR